MTGKPLASHGSLIVAAALAAAVFAGFATPAPAQPAWLKRALSGRQGDEGRRVAQPKVGRFAIEQGGAFVFDRGGRQPLIRFEDNAEVWALWAVRGPRGDILYRNDLGEVMLRATKLGGMTVFTSRRPYGAAAALTGPTSPLRLATIGPVALYQRLVQASVRSSRAAQHLIGFEAPQVDPASDGLIADAAMIVAGTMVSLSTRQGGKAVLSRVGKVAFVAGDRPSVACHGAVMTVVVAASQGLAGRPSSGRILRAMGTR